ncbi:hypothetical protein COX25_00050 [bacterium (Candidatus Howlettbacteria) CG23_combo_of_CG06-09_8_20_14_all_37_9]|nr:MAG: hypothetical protein COX25_00050 [bacterium (Candidatus Howlettbacteria) CG23_combo_of_CG06-09_8_20_14_all_37_9]
MNEDKILKKLIEHDQKFEFILENMLTKADGNRIYDILDRHSVILGRLDQERIFTDHTQYRVLA